MKLPIPKFLFWLIVGFTFSLTVSLYLISAYVGLDVSNGRLLEIYIYLSVLVGFIFVLSNRGKTAFGHLPFLAGWFLFLWAGALLWGNAEVTAFEKEKWWEIGDGGIKKYLALATFIGLLVGVAGTKMIWQLLPFARPFGGKR